MYDYCNGNWRIWICPAFYSQEKTNADKGGGYGGTWFFYLTSASAYLAHPQAGSMDLGDPNQPPPNDNKCGWSSIEMAEKSPAWLNISGSNYRYGVNSVNRIRNPSSISTLVEIYPAAGGWPGWDGRTFDERGGNARHGGNPTIAKGGNVLFVDGHVEWSKRIDPVLPWTYMCFTAVPK